MTDDFDPYLEWLDIEPHERPINHYRLLGVTPFTSDMALIRQAADDRMSKVHKFQMGRRGSLTQPILNALAGAKLCLLNPNTKATYDAVLAASLGMRQPLGQLSRPAFAEQTAAPVAPPPPLPPPAPPLAEPPPLAPPPLYEPPRPTPRNLQAPTTEYRPASRSVQRSSGLLPIVLLLGFLALGVFGWLIFKLTGQREETAIVNRPPPPPSTTTDPAPQNAPPAEMPADSQASAEPDPVVVTQQEGSGAIQFRPSAAQLAGGLQLENVDSRDAVTGFASSDDQAVWQFHLTQPGAFRARVEYAAIPGGEVGSFRLVSPGNFDKQRALRNDSAGSVTDAFIVAIKRGGAHSIVVVPQGISSDQQFRVFEIELIPIRGGQ